MKSRPLFSTLTVLAVFCVALFFPISHTYAAHGLAPIVPRILPGPFGGKIHNVTNCNCPLPYGKLIEVGPPSGGKFMVITGVLGLLGLNTTIYRHGKIDSGEWVLGNSAFPPFVCFQWSLRGCSEKGIGWRVNIIGTSDTGGGFGLPGL